MTLATEKIEIFCNIFHIPDFVKPWLDRFFEEAEIELVLLLGDKSLGPTEMIAKWRPTGKRLSSDQMKQWLHRCYKRGIISKCEDGRLKPANFHTRFDIWAVFEGWMDLPKKTRQQLNRWELDYYRQKHTDQIDALKNSRPLDPSKTWPTYLLIDEAEDIIDKVDYVYLWPCNCRAMMEGCQKRLYTCLRFSNNRGLGWEISASRAKKIIHQANQNGLMQNGEISIDADGTISGAICNCCSDCCFPQQLARQLEVHHLWPMVRYKAAHLNDRCTGCGLCVKRCPFGLFSKKRHLKGNQGEQSAEGAERKNRLEIILNADLCRGCGVCSSGCPEAAIEMVRLEHAYSSVEDLL